MCSHITFYLEELQWRHNERDCVSNHQPHRCLLKRLFRRRSKKISKLCITGLSEGNSPVTGEFPAQRSSNSENVFVWWRHHGNNQYVCILLQYIMLRQLSQYQCRWVSGELGHFYLLDLGRCNDNIKCIIRMFDWKWHVLIMYRT